MHCVGDLLYCTTEKQSILPGNHTSQDEDSYLAALRNQFQCGGVSFRTRVLFRVRVSMWYSVRIRIRFRGKFQVMWFYEKSETYAFTIRFHIRIIVSFRVMYMTLGSVIFLVLDLRGSTEMFDFNECLGMVRFRF